MTDAEFIFGPMQQFQGWCLPAAAHVTAHLFRLLPGGSCAFEIGVYMGKYLSLLYHLTGRAVGVDTFQYSDQQAVLEQFQKTFEGAPGLTLVRSDSQVLTPADVEAMLGCRPMFISVDGDHTAKPVSKDMHLAESSLGDRGIVALDDFYNRQAIGVTDGFFRYVHEGGTLVPFAFVQNKLFLARPEDHDTYLDAALEFGERSTLPEAAAFRELKQTSGRHHVVQELCGREVVLI